MESGQIFVVDAGGCDPAGLRSQAALERVFAAFISELDLRVVGQPKWHRFPEPGGITGYAILTESHLAVHTFPESGFAAFDLYCCRALRDFDFGRVLRELLGARDVKVRRVARGVSSE